MSGEERALAPQSNSVKTFVWASRELVSAESHYRLALVMDEVDPNAVYLCGTVRVPRVFAPERSSRISRPKSIKFRSHSRFVPYDHGAQARYQANACSEYVS